MPDDQILADLRAQIGSQSSADDDPILSDLRKAVASPAPQYDTEKRTYFNQPGVGLIKGRDQGPDAAGRLAALRGNTQVVAAPEQGPLSLSNPRTFAEQAKAEVDRGPLELIGNATLPMPGAILSGIGKYGTELGSSQELNQPWLASAGSAVQRAGEAITPGDWLKPTTVIGGIPSAVGKGVGSLLDTSQRGWNQLGELTGFPRVGAVVGSTVSAAPALLGAEQAVETGVGAAKSLIKGKAATPLVGPETPQLERTASGGGAASASVNPYPILSNAVYEKQGDEVPVLKPSMVAGAVPPAEQATRAQILRDVGVADATGGMLRDSSITGNPQDLWQEVTEKNRTESPAGDVIRRNMAAEQGAVRAYGDSLVERTGANMHIDPETSGQLIADPLYQARDLVRRNASEVYNEAYRRIGDNPIVSGNQAAVLADPDWRGVMTGSNESALKAIEGRLQAFQQEGMAGAGGPSTVRNAEQFRQFLEDLKDPKDLRLTRMINKLQEAGDYDVAAAGGGDLLKVARSNWRTFKENFDDPKGISSLITDPNDINRKVPYERVAQNFVNMPIAQATHVWQQIKNIPNIPGVTPELVQAGKAAEAELKGALVRRVREAAGSNASLNGVEAARVNNALLPKLKVVLEDDPELLQGLTRFSTAAQLVPDATMYRGAAIQGETLAQRAAVKAVPWAAGATGGLIGGAVGSLAGVPGPAAAAGATVGTNMGSAQAARMQASFAAERAKNLASRYAQNAQIGTKAP